MVWIAALAQSPGVKPKKTERLTLRMDPDLRKRIEQAALKRDRSKKWLVLHYVVSGLSRDLKTKRR